jgi:hypothetical protein
MNFSVCLSYLLSYDPIQRIIFGPQRSSYLQVKYGFEALNSLEYVEPFLLIRLWKTNNSPAFTAKV